MEWFKLVWTEAIQKLPNYQLLELDQELIKSVADEIENQIKEHKINPKKVDKKALLIEIFKQTFDIGEDKLKILEGMLQFMINRYIVKKRPLYKVIWKGAKKAVLYCIGK